MHTCLHVRWFMQNFVQIQKKKNLLRPLHSYKNSIWSNRVTTDCDIHLTQKCLQIRTEITGGWGEKIEQLLVDFFFLSPLNNCWMLKKQASANQLWQSFQWRSYRDRLYSAIAGSQVKEQKENTFKKMQKSTCLLENSCRGDLHCSNPKEEREKQHGPWNRDFPLFCF